MTDFWIILTGTLVAINCSILGSFLILRRMAMVGDAISHAVLPGIALAYLISGSRNSLFMLLGAAVIGVLTTFLIELLHKKARLQSDASIGITFTWLFAVGVILISSLSGNVDLDQECVLYGDIAFVPFDLLYAGGEMLGPVALWLQSGNALVLVLLVSLGYRGFFITSFDSSYAAGLGIQTQYWHYLLMSAVSLTVVLSFNIVGAILVVAFLVVPPASAYLLTRRLRPLLILAGGIGALSAISGYYLAEWWSASISASMAVASGLYFLLALLISQRSLWRAAKQARPVPLQKPAP